MATSEEDDLERELQTFRARSRAFQGQEILAVAAASIVGLALIFATGYWIGIRALLMGWPTFALPIAATYRRLSPAAWDLEDAGEAPTTSRRWHPRSAIRRRDRRRAQAREDAARS